MIPAGNRLEGILALMEAAKEDAQLLTWSRVIETKGWPSAVSEPPATEDGNTLLHWLGAGNNGKLIGEILNFLSSSQDKSAAIKAITLTNSAGLSAISMAAREGSADAVAALQHAGESLGIWQRNFLWFQGEDALVIDAVIGVVNSATSEGWLISKLEEVGRSTVKLTRIEELVILRAVALLDYRPSLLRRTLIGLCSLENLVEDGEQGIDYARTPSLLSRAVNTGNRQLLSDLIEVHPDILKSSSFFSVKGVAALAGLPKG